MTKLLEVKNLHVEIDGKKILNGLDLTIEKVEERINPSETNVFDK